MTETGAGSSHESEALALFEGFLTRYHEDSASFIELREAHPEHAPLFQRWWDQLVQTGEVSETPSDAKVFDLPEEGGRFGSYRIARSAAKSFCAVARRSGVASELPSSTTTTSSPGSAATRAANSRARGSMFSSSLYTGTMTETFMRANRNGCSGWTKHPALT